MPAVFTRPSSTPPNPPSPGWDGWHVLLCPLLQQDQGNPQVSCEMPVCQPDCEPRPVTVRSVKRRDRGKSLDRERRDREGSKDNINNSLGGKLEERAVMV